MLTLPHNNYFWKQNNFIERVPRLVLSCQSNTICRQGKWNMPALIISSMDRGTRHNVSFMSSACCRTCPKLAHPVGAMEPKKDASWHADHASSLSIHCHALKRQMEHTSISHQINGQRHTPQCIISALCTFAKSAQNQPICWVMWGLKGMHPDMQVMPQACQSIATHPEGK